MIRASFLLLTVVSFLSPAAAEENPGRAILAKVVEGMGGDAALAEVRGMRATYTGTYAGMPYRSEVIWTVPHRALLRVDAGPMFHGSMGIDGDAAWTAFGAPVARVRGPAKEGLLDWRFHNEILLVRPLLEREDVTIATVVPGFFDGDGETLREHVLVTFPGGKTYDLEIATGRGVSRLVLVTGPLVQMDGRRGTFRWDLSEHARLGEVVLPTMLRMRTYVGEKLLEDMSERLVSIEWNPEVTTATFAMPERTLPIDEPTVKDAPAVTGLVAIHHGPAQTMAETIGMLQRLCLDRGYMTMGPVVATLLDDGSEPEKRKGIEILVPAMLMGAPPSDLPAGVTVTTRPEARVAAVNCRGEYGKAAGAGLEALLAWLGEQKHEAAGPPRILFHHDPACTVPEDQISEVQIPIE